MNPIWMQIGAMVMLFVNAAQAARKWKAGQPGWAGCYAASFTCCVLALRGLYA